MPTHPGPFCFTSSWDDGHPLDMRVIELLQRHGFTGTFYVPVVNGSGLPVMGRLELRELAAAAEIGSHTRDHCYLTSVDEATARNQIRDGKAELEQLIGRGVPGFCYPGGKFTAAHQTMVKAAGFEYARTSANFCTGVGTDAFAVPTTLQMYPHSSGVYFRNWVRHGRWGSRYALADVAMSVKELGPRLRAGLLQTQRVGGVFHLWGHSWELDHMDGWRVLDEFLRLASDLVPRENRLTNRQAFASLLHGTPDVCTPRGLWRQAAKECKVVTTSILETDRPC